MTKTTRTTRTTKTTKGRISSAGGRWSRHAAGRGVALTLAMIPVLVEALPPWLLIAGIATLVVAAGQNGQPGSAPDDLRNVGGAGPSRAGRPVPRRVHHRVRASRRGGPAGRGGRR
ncbi:hypothetical protein ACFWBN_03200 [Streptomyces sp. NPDC059989]|uniref:hypothetical protein n=1 Tax=Streptomyces sp. NPDC059989 TaxID=3347026 RepID=UPI0036AC7D04